MKDTFVDRQRRLSEVGWRSHTTKCHLPIYSSLPGW